MCDVSCEKLEQKDFASKYRIKKDLAEKIDQKLFKKIIDGNIFRQFFKFFDPKSFPPTFLQIITSPIFFKVSLHMINPVIRGKGLLYYTVLCVGSP